MFLQQISGVPIGGWLSSSLLNLCASTCEIKLEARWPDLCKKYNLDLPRDQLFFAKRYEDDVLGISLKLCKNCLHTILVHTYLPGIVMDESNEHLVYENDYTANKFLDSMIFVTFDQIYFGIYNCNELFCLTGNMENHVKHRFAPAVGNERIVLDRLVCNILSRRARWQQLMLSTREVIKQTILDCSECIHLGYKPKTILKAYRKTVAHDRFFCGFI